MMCVAADTAAFRCSPEGKLEVLLVERGHDPFKGRWALPGGFVELDEDLPHAAARELLEETGLKPAAMDQAGAWGTPGRDPRGRTVSAVYVAAARAGSDAVKGGDDAVRAAWHPAAAPPPLAFDHGAILPVALAHLRLRCETTHMALAFLAETFSSQDVAAVLHVLGARHSEDSASRLLASARVTRCDAAGEMFRMAAPGFLVPLREPVFVFPVETSPGE
jgi:8-oxo-dGTP diphosphatase